MVFEILLWLPIVSLLRFKSVCKSWYSLIESYSFVYQHYHHIHVDRLEKDEENLIIIRNPHFSTDQCIISLISGKKNLFQVSENFHLPQPPFAKTDWVRLVISCNGIICVQPNLDYYNFFLLNPAIKQFRLLPKTPDLLTSSRSNYLKVYAGFGYNSRTDDYKVVRVVYKDMKVEAIQVDVCSLSTDSWKTIDAALVPHVTISYSGLTTPFRNKIYCWFADEGFDANNRSFGKTILSFDFSKDVFETIPLPDVYKVKAKLMLSLLWDNIACIEIVRRGKCDCSVWMLYEYGVKESWTKLYTISLDFGIGHRGVWKNGELICQTKLKGGREGETQFCLCNPVTQELKILSVPLPLRLPYPIAVYKDSLVSIKSANGATHLSPAVEPIA
ncbi:hypothetical protein AQUCO_01600144v1 [Aquilegia coerulea]|uniref:F-box domain-containing protein n=1 Tax=Aquilegia coerulea TaxID=218851 RepID=A0A2G5DQJ8_AQUCA|nr:hypothetical protein AQUCO_01600144v1 [Aquilegia coerulea]